jgi:hypothetical protein
MILCISEKVKNFCERKILSSDRGLDTVHDYTLQVTITNTHTNTQIHTSVHSKVFTVVAW